MYFKVYIVKMKHSTSELVILMIFKQINCLLNLKQKSWRNKLEEDTN